MPASFLFPVVRRLVIVPRRLLTSLALFAMPILAAAQNVITLRADSARRFIPPSSKLAVPVILDMSAAGGTNLAALSTGVTFGPGQVTFDSVKTAGFGTLTSTTSNAAGGSLTLGVSDAAGTTATQPLATMYFTASATAGGTTIAFLPTLAGSATSVNILALVRSRGLDICVAPSGLWGDVNGDSITTPLGDGSVNIIDAQQIARYQVGLSVANRPGLVARGDVTNDGSVNIIDAQQIARFNVGLGASVRVNMATFMPPAVVSVAISPSTAQAVTVGATLQLSATARDAASADVTPCVTVTWSSSNTAVATVSGTGLVAAGSAGTATITATNGDKSATVTVTVNAFGVDIAAPVITAGTSTDNVGYLDANERRGAAATMVNNFGVSVVDTGTVGNSGMLTGNAVMGTVMLRNDANALLTAATKCVVGVIDANDGVTCLAAPVNSNPAPGLPWVVVSPTAGNSAGAGTPGATAVTGAVAPGYYTYVAYARDAAGNTSGAITRTVAFDVLGNVPALTSAVYNTPLTGGSVTFSATASDNFDLRDASYALTYATLPGPVVYPSTTINTFNGTQVYSNVAAGITIPNFMRQVELITAQAPIAIGGGAGKPTALNGRVRDQSNQVSAVANTAIAGASVTTGVSYTAALAPQLVRSFAITNVATSVSNNAGPAAATAALSVTLVADVFGATATFNPPFARVDFYAFFGGNLFQIGSTTAVVSTDDGSAFGRKHSYSISWTPGISVGLGATALYAVGVNTAGDALVTPWNTTITIINP